MPTAILIATKEYLRIPTILFGAKLFLANVADLLKHSKINANTNVSTNAVGSVDNYD